MSKVICPECKGRRKIFGMGFMYTACSNCKETGYVDKADEPKAKTVVAEKVDSPSLGDVIAKVEPRAKKKAGRPPKIIKGK